MTYSSFITYIKALGAAHKSIKTVIHADYEDILTRERTGIEYPVLWIETPTVRYAGDNDAVREIYEGAIIILKNTNDNDPVEVEQNLKDTFAIARDFLFRMALYDNKMSITNKRLEAIATLGNDNDQGWRLAFEMEMEFDNTDVCIDATKWNDII
jgi:hypothetical protein